MLQLTDLEKTFSSVRGERVHALDGVSLTVPEGMLFTLLGASGSRQDDDPPLDRRP